MPYYNRDPQRDHNFDNRPYVDIMCMNVCVYIYICMYIHTVTYTYTTQRYRDVLIHTSWVSSSSRLTCWLLFSDIRLCWSITWRLRPVFVGVSEFTTPLSDFDGVLNYNVTLKTRGNPILTGLSSALSDVLYQMLLRRGWILELGFERVSVSRFKVIRVQGLM